MLSGAFVEKRRIVRIEAEMPVFLRTFGMLLEMKVPFVQALKASAKGEMENEFSKIVKEIEKGASVPKALAEFAERTRSAVVKKSVAQLISAYEHGAHGKEIIRIADDLISLQRYALRDFISRSSLFGLLFVIFSAVVPTFFLVFATAGKFALDAEIGRETFLLVFLIGFPLINGAILHFSGLQMPPSIFRNSGSSRSEMVFLAVAAVLAAVMLLDAEMILKAGVLLIVCALFWAMFRNEYFEERRVEQLEGALPDALLGVSGLPKNYGIDRIFDRMANAKNAVGDEAAKTLRQLRANVSAEKALTDLWKRNESFMLRRMCELMMNANTAGANISEKMHELAEDLLKFDELRRERANAFAMQKYTLLLAALIIPLILSSSLSVVNQMSSFMEAGNGDVLEAAPNAITAYIIAYSALSALYISRSEEKRTLAIPYFAAMALVGLAAFYIFSQQFA